MVDRPEPTKVPRWLALGFRITLIFMAFLTACMSWYYVRAERWDTPPLIPVLAALELPFIVAFLLVFKNDKQTRTACDGAGIAFGAGAFFALAAPVLAFDAGFTAWESRSVYKNLVAFEHLQLAMFVVGILLMILSWRFGKDQRIRFWILFGMSVAYLFLSAPLLARFSQPGAGARKEALAWANPSEEAYRSMMRIGGCLIRNEASRPGVDFPRSLAQMPRDWNCDRKYTRTQPVLQYTLDYTPEVDVSSGEATDFRLVVIPLKNAGGRVVPLMMDRRGILFAYAGWADNGNAAHVVVFSGSALPQLQKVAEKFKSEHGGRAPTSFRVLPDLQNWWPRPIEGDGKIIRMDVAYDYLISEPRPQDLSRYAMSARCEDYAHSCILSYFLDYDGVMHETNQPRPATSEDPVTSACETDYLECTDIDWPLPESPSKSRILIVSVRQALNSTSLW